MLRKTTRLLTCIGLIIFALLFASWLVARYTFIEQAKTEAQNIIAEARKENPNATDDEKIINLTRIVYKQFEHKDPSDIFFYKLRPYLSNRRLPEFIRLPKGIIASLIRQGYCDSAARWLLFILEQENFKSVQWNLASPDSSHAALLVTMHDGRNVFVDPYFGYVAVDDKGKLINPFDARQKIKTGARFEKVFKSLDKNSDPHFYHNFSDMMMSAQGEPLILSSTLPSLRNGSLVLGKIDGEAEDVKDAGTSKGLGYYWNYLGHQYSRKWVRVLKVRESVRITMTLVSEPSAGALNSIGHPAVDGKKIVWNLEPGQDLTFIDGLSHPSWKSLRSYVGVDQIIFEYRK